VRKQNIYRTAVILFFFDGNKTHLDDRNELDKLAINIKQK